MFHTDWRSWSSSGSSVPVCAMVIRTLAPGQCEPFTVLVLRLRCSGTHDQGSEREPKSPTTKHLRTWAIGSNSALSSLWWFQRSLEHMLNDSCPSRHCSSIGSSVSILVLDSSGPIVRRECLIWATSCASSIG
jgi:hypothetical protein